MADRPVARDRRTVEQMEAPALQDLVDSLAVGDVVEVHLSQRQHDRWVALGVEREAGA